ncbi:hypothetical protein [Pantoea agglomerans]|uniref:hypothetical protein n=1 Tax=Enterobacter agglomerans TaxID=549 RepID=UPI000DADFB3B|nr:hypothetical protein [Pantoea agglomerans]RAH33218.1 hypothetical protein DOT37_02990 [Pantoea agglomerans]TGX93459.1 hypothetical protein E5821_02985 [Pantoea agglomerans]
MKPLSERIKDFPANQFVDWLCLSCVDVREVNSEEDAQDEINKIRQAVTVRLTGLEQRAETAEAKLAIKWRQVSKDGEPVHELGESALYWVCYRSNGNGQLYVTQAVWFNQPQPEDNDEDDSADCELYTPDGEPYWPVGWHQNFCHEDFSTYYLGWDWGEIVAYAELNAPGVPYQLLTGKDDE